jgi:hypothetical protein
MRAAGISSSPEQQREAQAAEEGGADRGQEQRRGDHRAGGEVGARVVVDRPVQQAGAAGVQPGAGDGEARQRHAGGVEDHREVVAWRGVGAHQGGRERHERDRQQEDQIQPQQPLVVAADQLEQAVVGDPELPDHQEADHEAQHLGPQRPDLVRQPAAALREVDLGRQRQHQQGDDDGEHGVAEEDEPLQAHRALVGVRRRHAHPRSSLD